MTVQSFPYVSQSPARLQNSFVGFSGVKGYLLIGFLSLLCSVLIIWSRGTPPPQVHDEFSYLLAGDTFASGRLANPTHPMWKHFESFHIIQIPSYVSKYPPGQGLFIALGFLLGNPLFGIWIQGALAAIAVYYLLSSYFSKAWAFGGTLIGIAHPLAVQWNFNYMGGSLQILGGALTLGALIRSLRDPDWKTSIVLGVGVSSLAISRPFEGAVFTALSLVFTSVALWRRDGLAGIFRVAGKIGPISGAIVLATLLWLGFYNYRTTGDALLMPYMIHEEYYRFCPAFAVQDPGPTPEYAHPIFYKFAAQMWGDSVELRSLGGFMGRVKYNLSDNAYYWTAYGLLALPLVAMLWASRRRLELRAGLLFIGLFVLNEIQLVWLFPHYIAAGFGLFVLLCVVGFQELAKVHRYLASFVVILFPFGFDGNAPIGSETSEPAELAGKEASHDRAIGDPA